STTEAATARERGAIAQGESRAAGSSEMGSWEGGTCETGSGRASSPAFRVSPDTSDASNSMVGGARLARPESGDPESGDGVLSSGLSSTIAPVPHLLVPNITRFGASY